jgi:hypothetical protein
MRVFMKIKVLGSFALVAITLLLILSSALGYSSGRWDRAKTGCECHSVTADPTVTVIITGQPAEYEPLASYPLTITVSGGPASAKGGFNLEVSKGSLSSTDPNVQIDIPQTQATHTNPDQRSWSVTWTAPAQGSADVTFWLAGNAVNGNGGTSGDGWDLFSQVISEVLPPDNIITLKQGWNLISIPYVQEDKSVGMVLGSIEGSYDRVQNYNNSIIDDPWRDHIVEKPFGNDLAELDEKMGIWIHVNGSGDTIFLYNGSAPAKNQTIPIYTGWNLVGYPSLDGKLRDTALNNIQYGSDIDLVQTYNATSKLWEDVGEFDYLEIGLGYWIHSNVNKVWEVPL